MIAFPDNRSTHVNRIIIVSDVTATTNLWTIDYGDAYYGWRYSGNEPREVIVLEPDPMLAKLRRMLERTRAAVDRFAELVRRLPPRAAQTWASPVTPRPSAALQGLRRWKRRTCGEHNRYRVMVA